MSKFTPAEDGSDIPAVNTDRELYREDRGDPMDPDNVYSDRVFITQDGKLGIASGGMVHVMSIKAWHTLASIYVPTPRFKRK